MDSTPPAIARAFGALETHNSQSMLEFEQNQTPLHKNAKGEHSYLALGDPWSDKPAAAMGPPPQEARRSSRMRLPRSAMRDLTDVFDSTDLTEAPLVTQKDRKKQNRQAKKLRRKEAAAAMTPEQRVSKRAKKKRNKREKRQSIQPKRTLPDYWRPPHSGLRRSARLSHLSQMIQNDQMQEQDGQRQGSGEEDWVDTASVDVQYSPQYSPDDRLDRAMKALHGRKAMGPHRPGGKGQTREESADDLYGMNGNMDKMME
jgi:hypothetical protein